MQYNEQISSAQAASMILLDGSGAACLQQRDVKDGIRFSGLWSFPGGTCTHGETTRDCILREITEETGYRCNVATYLTTVGFIDGSERYEVDFFWSDFKKGGSIVCNEGRAMQFFQIEEARSLYCLEELFPLWRLAMKHSRNIEAC